jgi:penicillin-binding protein 2
MVSKRKYKRFSTDIEPNEVFMDSLSSRQEEALGIPERKLEVPLYKVMLNTLLVFCFLLLGGLLGKTFYIGITEGEEYKEMAERNKYIHHKVQALRGVIYSSDMKQLVYNKLSFDLLCDRNYLPEDEGERNRIISMVADILKKEVSEIDSLINESEDDDLVIASNIDHQQLVLLETEIDKLDGFDIKNNTVRDYPEGEIFSHVIGYTGKISPEELAVSDNYAMTDYIGRMGIEKSYEEVLHRKAGEIKIERNADGNEISKGSISLPDSGDNLVLHLDYGLQKKLSEVLGSMIKEVGTKKAAAVALDPRNGGVLAMVSFPEYDNNIFTQGSSEELSDLLSNRSNPLFNRAISGQYPTGSTIKPIVALGALEEEIISPNKTIEDYLGYIEVPNQYDHSITYKYKDNDIHGVVDMRKAIAVSCNTYFFTIGGGYQGQKGLGLSNIKKYLELFGWGKETGVNLPGEKNGLIPDNEWKEKVKGESWYVGDTYNLSIGQGNLLATPLQVASAYVAIANGGTLFEPQLVKKSVDSNGNTILDMGSKVIRNNFFSKENIKVVQEGMRQTVTSGSATYLNGVPVAVAAKTGTAETSYIDTYHNWLASYAPYDNPEIVLLVMIENVEGVRSATVPVTREVLDWYFGERE